VITNDAGFFECSFWRTFQRLCAKDQSDDAPDDRVILGRGILGVLSGLQAPGAMSSYLLYLGRDGPVVIHRGWGRVVDVAASEVFTLNVDGALSYDFRGGSKGEQGRQRTELGIPLRVEADYTKLYFDSVEGLHRVVTSQGFFDDLAYRLSRVGRTGVLDAYTLDPDAEQRRTRRLSLA